MKIDLHTHSTFSDGTLNPEELVCAAAKEGITHLALSDHDTTGGLLEARTKAQEFNITIIPAIEINTKESTSVHILGYCIDEKNESLQKTLAYHREIRFKRAQMILEKLQKMGIKISLSDFDHSRGSAAIGRPHIADKLKEKGIVFSRKEAFEKYLSQGKAAYVFYEGPTPQDAINVILACEGLPVLAHPGYSVSEETISSLIKSGLQGIEIYYPTHKSEQIQQFLGLAGRYDLVTTGGSDYHGPGSGHENLGEIEVPEQTVENLLQRKQKLFTHR